MSERWTRDRLDGPDWPEEFDDAVVEQPVGYVPEGMVTLRYLWDAVRRHARIWLACLAVGVALGAAAPVVLPSSSEATTTVMLTHREGDDPAQAVATDVELARTRTVAEHVVTELRLPGTADDLLKRYTVTQLTERIVLISVQARSDAESTRIASTLASTFLAFRMQQVRVQLQPTRVDLVGAMTRLAELQQRRVEDVAADGEAGKPDQRLQNAEAKVADLRQRLSQQQILAASMSSSRVLDPAVLRRDEIAPKTRLEASGGLRLENARAYAETGVDYLAVGALTHSAVAIDVGMDLG